MNVGAGHKNGNTGDKNAQHRRHENVMNVHNMNILAVVRSQEAATELNLAGSGINGHKLNIQVGSLEQFSPINDENSEPNLLLLEVDAQSDQDIALLDRIIRQRFPNTPVIATAPEMTLQDVRRLMRHGVVDVLPQPIARSDLLTAVDHATRAFVASGPNLKSPGKVVSFIKGGGGAGATTVAVQAGCLLGSNENSERKNVCLIDLDIQFGTAALYLDLDSDLNVSDLIEAGSRLDSSLLHDVAHQHESGLDVIAAPSQILPLDAVAPDFITACLAVARDEYDYVLLDLPDAWTAWSFAALKHSDLIVLVTQLSVAGIRQAKRQLDTLAAQGLEDIPINIVLNRFKKGWEQTITIDEAQKALGRGIDCRIANDYKIVNEALNQGLAVGKVKKRSKVEKSIQALVEGAIEQLTASEK